MDDRAPNGSADKSFLDKISESVQTGYNGFQKFRESNEQMGRNLVESALTDQPIGGLSEDQLATLQLKAFGMEQTPENMQAAKMKYEPAFMGSVSNVGTVLKAGENLRKVSGIVGTATRASTGAGALTLVDEAVQAGKNLGKIIIKP